MPDTRPLGTALVTGANGFVGRHVVERLVADGVRVRALVRDPARVPWPGTLPVETVTGDITRRESLDPVVAGIDTVFHLAAVDKPADRPLSEYREINARGTGNLVAACLASGSPQRFVHASSVAVYGACPPGVEYDEMTEPAPIERYAVTKLEGEDFVRAAANELSVVIARLEWIYGPHSSTTQKLFERIARRKMLLIGPGKNTHQPIWIGDVVEGLMACGRAATLHSPVYNFAGQRAITVEEEFATIADALGVTLPSVRIPMPLMQLAVTSAERLFGLWGGSSPVNSRQLDFFRISRAHSNRRAETELGWRPAYSYEDGVCETAKWLAKTGQLR